MGAVANLWSKSVTSLIRIIKLPDVGRYFAVSGGVHSSECPPSTFNIHLSVLVHRFATSSPGAPAHRIFTVCLPMDEQPADARDAASLCD